MKNLSRKRISIILIIYALIFNLVGGTLAYWNWESENTLITFSVDEAFMCSADVGGDINPENVSLAPALCTSEKNAIKKRLVVYPTVLGDLTVGLDLWLEINSIAPELSATENFKYALTTDENSCTNNVVATGSFTGKEAGDTVELLKQQIYRESIYEGEEYWLYIWLDAAETSLSTANKSFNFVLNGTCKDHFEDYNYLVNFDANGGIIETTTYTTVGEHTYTVSEDGTYKLETWGAQGGTSLANGSYSRIGGYGGYSVGMLSLSNSDTLYVNVGGKGTDGVELGTASGGYNGGGSGTSDGADNEASGGGGGATHIANKSGKLSALSSSINSILIVSGGGGGASYTYSAGSGGGIYGGVTSTTSSSYPTQSSGYAFGQGQNGSGVADSDGVAGGGGGYYGGYSNDVSAKSSGTGGSGYIGNSLLTNKAMYCYECTTSSDASTLTYSTTNVSATPTANYAKSGDGAARISKLSSTKGVTFGDTYGTLPTPTRNGYAFLEWNTESDGSGQTITNTSVADITSDQTLYAIWELSICTLSYDANGGTGAPASQTDNCGTSITISSTTPTRSGYTFLGWSTDSTATSATYSAGESYTGNENVTLYAVWCGHSYSHTVTKPTLTAQGYTTHTCTICGYSYKDSYTSAAATGSTVNGSSGYIGRNYTYSFTFTTPDFSGTASSVTVSLPISGQGTTNIGVYYYLSGTYHGSWEIYNNDTTQSKTIYATIYPNTTYTVSFEHWSAYPYGWGIVTGKPSVRLG